MTTPDQAGDAPLLALWAQHVSLRNSRVPEGIEDDEEYSAATGDQMTAVESEILSKRAETMAGARVHIALLAWLHVEGCVDHVLQPHLRRLAGRAAS